MLLPNHPPNRKTEASRALSLRQNELGDPFFGVESCLALIYTYIQNILHKHMNECVCSYVSFKHVMHKHIHIHIRIYIYTYAYICMHICMCHRGRLSPSREELSQMAESELQAEAALASEVRKELRSHLLSWNPIASMEFGTQPSQNPPRGEKTQLMSGAHCLQGLDPNFLLHGPGRCNVGELAVVCQHRCGIKSTYFSWAWDVHWGYDLDFDPWPIRCR